MERFSAPWGVAINAISLGIALVGMAASIPLGIDVATSERVPRWPAVVLLSGAAMSAIGGLWVLFRVVRWQLAGLLPRFDRGRVEIAMPRSIHPHLALVTLGLAIFVPVGVWLIVDLATRQPITLWRAIGLGVMTVLIAVLAWTAWVLDHVRRARLVADDGGLRWDRILTPGTRALGWHQIERIELEGDGVIRSRIVVVGTDGSTHRLVLFDPSIPMAVDAYRSIVADLQRQRPDERNTG